MYKIVIRGRNCGKYLKKCLKSLRKQEVEWEGLLILDAPEDNSYKIAKKLVVDLPIEIVLNPKRMGLGYNLWWGIENCGARQEDVVCILDADDYLHKRALKVVEKAYKKGFLLTYGSYIKLSKGKPTRVSRKYKTNNVRKSAWHGSHLKTFKYKLWKYFPEDYFKHKGKWAEASSDRALMYTLMEIAGMKKCKFIDKAIYFWRDGYKHSTSRKKQLKWDTIFRGKKPLKPQFVEKS